MTSLTYKCLLCGVDHPIINNRIQHNGFWDVPTKQTKTKLTGAMVKGIRREYKSREWTMRQLASKYHIHHSTIWKIIHKLIWRRITITRPSYEQA